MTCAGWQIPFVTSVVNTYASWRAEFAAEVCPTDRSLEIHELQSVGFTSARSRTCSGHALLSIFDASNDEADPSMKIPHTGSKFTRLRLVVFPKVASQYDKELFNALLFTPPGCVNYDAFFCRTSYSRFICTSCL